MLKAPLTIDSSKIPQAALQFVLYMQEDRRTVRTMPLAASVWPPKQGSTQQQPPPSTWVTLKCAQCITCGTYEWAVKAVALGNPQTKAATIGLVPATMAANGYEQRLHKSGGWGLATDGRFCGSAQMDGNTSSSAAKRAHWRFDISVPGGERIQLRLNADKGTIVYTIGGKQLPEVILHDFECVRQSGGVCPAISVYNYGAQFEFDIMTDVTPLDAFSQLLQVDPHNGEIWQRAFKRMSQSGDRLRVQEQGKTVMLSKDEVRMRTVIWGSVDMWNNELGAIVKDEKRRDAFWTAAEIAAPNFFNSLLLMLDCRMKQGAKDSSTVTAVPKDPEVSQLREDNARLTRLVADKTNDLEALKSRVVMLENQQEKLNAQLIRLVQNLLQEKIPEDAGARNDVAEIQTTSPKASLQDTQTMNIHTSSGATATIPAAFAHKEPKNNDDILKPAKPVHLSPGGTPGRRPSNVQKGRPKAMQRPIARQLQKRAPANRTATRASSPPLGTLNGWIHELQKQAETIRELGEIGCPSDDDLKNLQLKRGQYGARKLEIVKHLHGRSISTSETEESKKDLVELLEDLVSEGDQATGNAELVAAILQKIPTSFADTISEGTLAATAAYDGSQSFLRMLLSYPNIKILAIELLQSSFYNQTCRIPISLIVLSHIDCLCFGPDDIEAIQPLWQEFFEDIASTQRAIPKEDRTGRTELLKLMAASNIFHIDTTVEGPDSQTVVSRAAREGDLELLKLLHARGLITEPNRVQSDSTTALIQAVVANHVEIVEFFVKYDSLQVAHVSQEGSAEYLARALNRDVRIVRMLSHLKHLVKSKS